MHFVLFETATRRIVAQGHDPDPDGNFLALQRRPKDGIDAIETPGFVDPSIHWVPDRDVRQRPSFPASIGKSTIVADGVDEAVITDLPEPCVLMIDGHPHAVEGGVIRIVSDMPAVYLIECSHWPYLDWRMEIVAQ